MNKLVLSLAIFAFILSITSCKTNSNKPKSKNLVYNLIENQNIPLFDSTIAFSYIKSQIQFGPRNPNSFGHRQTRDFLYSELKNLADTIFLQNFRYTGYNEYLELSNIIASFNPQKEERILICAHWDTRPRAEKDPNLSNKNLPILGANDGASGVAIILTLAKIINKHPVDFGIDFVLFDGEDYGKEGDLVNYSIGAKYFIQNKPEYIQPVFAILLDMVGDKEAKFLKEPNSMNFAPEIVDLIWNLAEKLNLQSFSNETTNAIYDDHVPLGEMGIKIIDIIDADLIGADTMNPRRNYWHTQNDTIENIGLNTLGEVGRLLTHLIYSLNFTEK